jgi:hypothetical protein
MLFVTEYRLKSHLTKDDVKRLMDEFGRRWQLPEDFGRTVAVECRVRTTVARRRRQIRKARPFVFDLRFVEITTARVAQYAGPESLATEGALSCPTGWP